MGILIWSRSPNFEFLSLKAKFLWNEHTVPTALVHTALVHASALVHAIFALLNSSSLVHAIFTFGLRLMILDVIIFIIFIPDNF